MTLVWLGSDCTIKFGTFNCSAEIFGSHCDSLNQNQTESGFVISGCFNKEPLGLKREFVHQTTYISFAFVKKNLKFPQVLAKVSNP